MTLTRSHGKDVVFSLDDSGGTLRAIFGDLDAISGLPGAAQLSEVTAFGDGGERFIRGLEGTTFTLSGMFSTTASTGSITVMNGNRTKTTTSTFEYGPEGSTTGKIKYSGECWMESFDVGATVKDKVPFSATFKLDNTLTVGAY